MTTAADSARADNTVSFILAVDGNDVKGSKEMDVYREQLELELELDSHVNTAERVSGSTVHQIWHRCGTGVAGETNMTWVVVPGTIIL